MVEVHGWLTLRYSDYHSEAHRQTDFIDQFKQFIRQHCPQALDEQLGYGKLIDYNGLNCFTLNTQHNHPGSPFYPLEIFRWAAEVSTGSYGMLYFLDDEDALQHNEFQVYILKRGKLVKAADPFLSPYIGEIEKEYDPNEPPQD